MWYLYRGWVEPFVVEPSISTVWSSGWGFAIIRLVIKDLLVCQRTKVYNLLSAIINKKMQTSFRAFVYFLKRVFQEIFPIFKKKLLLEIALKIDEEVACLSAKCQDCSKLCARNNSRDKLIYDLQSINCRKSEENFLQGSDVQTRSDHLLYTNASKKSHLLHLHFNNFWKFQANRLQLSSQTKNVLT